MSKLITPWDVSADPKYAGSGGPAIAASVPRRNIEIDGLPTQLRDVRVLAGYSDAIFVAKVVSAEGTRIVNGLPWTTFNTDLLHVLKGHPASSPSVSVIGGFIDGVLNIPASDMPIIPGECYVFFVRLAIKSCASDCDAIPHYGRAALNTASVDAIRSGDAESVPTIAFLKEAISQQLPLGHE